MVARSPLTYAAKITTPMLSSNSAQSRSWVGSGVGGATTLKLLRPSLPLLSLGRRHNRKMSGRLATHRIDRRQIGIEQHALTANFANLDERRFR